LIFSCGARGSKAVLESQDGDRLVVVLDDLEALLAVEVESVLDAVLCAQAHVGAAAVHVGVAQHARVVLEVGIGEAQQGVDGEGGAGGDDVVQVGVGVDGAHAVVLEVVHELGGDAQAADGLDLELEAEAGHGVLGRKGELCAHSNVALVGADAEGGNDGQKGRKD